MPKYIGTTEGIIDWDSIVKICHKSTDGDFNAVGTVVERSEATAEGDLLDSYRAVINIWKAAGYNLKDIQWYDYYPGTHFSKDIDIVFGNLINADARRTFVSEVWPGSYVPYHWDVEDKEKEWLSEGELKRWVCFMDKPKFGHVLVFNHHCFYNVKQHEIWEWDHYKDWHAGSNSGSEPYYLFHFLGKPR
jgi:hypothetical protein